ncbi:MAG: carboxypeptidase-like regulatory domain-containing protein [Burkholderiales bacterium]
MRSLLLRRAPVALAVSVLVAACGGGGGGSGEPPAAAAPATSTTAAPAPITLTGTAAIGAPLPGATVTLRDASGTVLTTTTDSGGRFAFADLKADDRVLQLAVSAQLGQRQVVHYALVPGLKESRTANVTPLTTAIASLAAGSAVPTDLDASVLASLSPETVRSAGEQLGYAIAPLVAKLAPGMDPLGTPFVADGRGVDLVLDHLEVTIRPDAVYVANKMAMGGVDDASTAAGTAKVPRSALATKSVSRTGKAVADGVTQVADASASTDGFDELAARFADCFAVPADQRMTNRSTASATVHPACASLALPGYQHNGTDFALRWARALNSTTIDTTRGASFLRPEVRLRVSSSPERIAVNLNFRDADGNGYTTPEVIEKQADGTWRLYGNRRAANGFVEATLSHRTDLTRAPAGTGYANVNTSQVEAGFRLSFDPRLTFGADGSIQYPVADFTTATGYASALTYTAVRTAAAAASPARSAVGCVVVTGPGRFDTTGNKWMGFFPHGLVLKRPTSSPLQDYMAIDGRLTPVQRQALDAAAIGQAVSGAGNGTANSGFCGDGTTVSSSPAYVVENEALKNQVNPLTGAADPSIDGRDVLWNTGARYARMAPDADMVQQLSSNPLVTFHVIDNTGVLRMRFSTRYLGELPPVSLMKDLVALKKVSLFDRATLSRWLDFDAGGADITGDVSTVSAAWTTAPNAFGADGIGFYSEVYRSIPGAGLRGPLSIWPASQSGGTSGLWASDPDLAADLDAMPGTNFYWWNGTFAREPVNGSCSGSTPTVMNSNVTLGVGRGDRSFADRALGARWLGTDALARACLGTGGSGASNAALDRELWTRTYTDKNVRVYVYVQNKRFR